MSEVGGSRPSRGPQRKASYADGAVGDEGYYGDGDWWGTEGYQYTGYDGGYYDEWQGEAGGDSEIFEVDLYSMTFVLDNNLEPKELYQDFEFDEKSFLMVLEADDVQMQSPAAWRSPPLKIHPEPSSKPEKKEPTPRVQSGAASGDLDTGASTPTALGSPRAGPKTPIPVRSVETIESKDQTMSPGGTPKTPGPATSPKIVISNSQLEHLKQKMQALKQRRTDPVSTPPATAVAMTSPAAPADDAGSAKRQVYSNCPGLHGLSRFFTPDPGWWCSVCEREHGEGSAFYGCRTCDYDECETCALTPLTSRQKSGAAGESKATPAVTPPASAEGSAATSSPQTTKSSRKGTPKRSPPQASPRVQTSKTKVTAAPPASSSTGSSEGSESRSASPQAVKPKKKETKEKKVPVSKEKPSKVSKPKAGKSGGQQVTEKVKVKKSEKAARPAKVSATKKSSDDEKKEEEPVKKKRKKDPKLVPRSSKGKPEISERFEKRVRKEKEASPRKRKAVAAPRSPPSRSPSPPSRSRSHTSRSDKSSEEELRPRKRAANSLTVTPAKSGTAKASVVSLKGSNDTLRREDGEKRKADEGPTRTVTRRTSAPEAPARSGRQARGDGGMDLLRRVLRAQNVIPGGPKANSNRAVKEGEPRATLLPPSRKDQSGSEEEGSPARSGGPVATLRPPSSRTSSKKAESKKPRRA
mmetsp:Transcript_96418/g.171412  ORF Transcript_96418/g.171412 Transcript_96418/m.171412 type:complete len:695 (-) Transcript_96418:54-2138(-)|eukprot:CAMPEP_0197626060 /NCGR_PEP_ID=MMETSP1338-20131121/5206_1 /TAXON_ID=43686 ORGANISM="Pelagodinium beii, Strain RCC1491" /NCGR_SAMPLE_ID=MMETSP1338 /ASSEMBLY_ACC=CAM_ASM_000754 /LENGTH=694 /DNA_ID=CAMNT_0043196577 /DNA_START=109 /DNA_END=2193 /DNA_ORIENTATION=-